MLLRLCIRFDSCGGFKTPMLCIVTKGVKTDCNYIRRTTYPDICVRIVDSNCTIIYFTCSFKIRLVETTRCGRLKRLGDFHERFIRKTAAEIIDLLYYCFEYGVFSENSPIYLVRFHRDTVFANAEIASNNNFIYFAASNIVDKHKTSLLVDSGLSGRLRVPFSEV